MKPLFWKVAAITEALILLASVVFVARQYPMFRAMRYHFFDRACAFGDDDGVKMLLELGAEPNGGRDYEYYVKCVAAVEPTAPLFQSAWQGDPTVMSLL